MNEVMRVNQLCGEMYVQVRGDSLAGVQHGLHVPRMLQ